MRLANFSNLKLSQKGLILVCLPVAVMVVFLGTLLFVLQRMEGELNEKARSEAIMTETARLSKLCYDIGVAVVLLDYTKSTITKNRLEENAKMVPARLQKMRELAHGDPTELELIQRIEKFTNKINLIITRYLQYLENKDAFPFINLSNLYSEFHSLGNDFTGAMHDLTAYEASKGSARTSEPQARAILKNWILFGVVLNIVMGILLAVSFNRMTARRLQLLTDNTMRLAQKAPLNEPMSGNDEIAQLDRFFHSMATALAAAARKERAILENAVDVICSIDDRGNFTALNPACQAVWGFAEQELIGQPYSRILHPDDLHEFAHSLREGRIDRKTQIIETRALREDETTIFVRWSLRWSDSEQSSFCVAHDITERKEIERVKEEFIAMVSHDLRTPLTSLEALLTLVLEGTYGTLTEHGKQRIAGAEQDIDRLIKMITDLLDIEMLESGHLQLVFEQIDMDTVINRSLDAVRGFADQKKVLIEVTPVHVNVNVDSGRLVQVCVNFLSNAIKYSTENSTVTITTRAKDGFVEVHVIDRGPGIPAGYETVVFERYKQIGPSSRIKQQGTGLGLAICKTIVMQHGGEIGVESEASKGSNFWFRIPATVKDDNARPDRSIPVHNTQISA
jgi:PAS domain S-box-containing protein